MKTTDENTLDENQSPYRTVTTECPERRRQRRLCPPMLSGILDVRQQKFVVTISNLSLTGAKVLNGPPGLNVGDTLRLAAMIGDRTALAFPCTVIHIKGNEAHLEIGVRFDPVDPSNSRELGWYLNQNLDNAIESAAAFPAP